MAFFINATKLESQRLLEADEAVIFAGKLNKPLIIMVITEFTAVLRNPCLNRSCLVSVLVNAVKISR